MDKPMLKQVLPRRDGGRGGPTLLRRKRVIRKEQWNKSMRKKEQQRETATS